MEYENLLREADELNVIVKEKHLKTKDGLCYGKRIAINNQLESNEEKVCILAEELGHYCTTIGDITDQTKVENRKQELLARRWAYQKLIGPCDLIRAYKDGIKGTYNLAEYLGVTEEFFIDAIEYYKSKYGLFYKIDTYILIFEPLGVVDKFIDF